MKLRIVVTGARGFVGSIFALRAFERGHAVLALDDESRGLNDIEAAIGLCYQRHDCLGGMRDIAASFLGTTDVVAHFAAATGSLERPIDELRDYNVGMTQRVYEDALALGAKTFLWPTTSLALGVPDSPYVQSKEEGLTKLREIDAKARISVPVRFFNVAGAYKGFSELRRNEVHAIPVMLQNYLNRTPFIVNGDDYDTVDGTPSRDFVHIFDVVEYLLDIAEGKIHPCAHRTDGAVWLGTGIETTVRHLIRLFDHAVGHLDHRIGPRRAFDCGRLVVDPDQRQQFWRARNGLAPSWVAVRDELTALLHAPRELLGLRVIEVEPQAKTVPAMIMGR